MIYRLGWVLILMLGFSGCATLDRDACLAGDWYQIGLSDGQNGYPVKQQNKHNEACADYGIAVVEADYLRGHADGLVDYCTPEKGYRVGLNRGHYANVCPDETEAAFLDAYREGRHRALLRCLDEIERDWYFYGHHGYYGRHYYPFTRIRSLHCY